MWGESGTYTGHRMSSLAEVLGIHVERTIYDTMAVMITHGVFDRHPKLKVAVLELGSGWVPNLFRRLKIAYGKAPQNFGREPIQSFIDHVHVMPFYEDDLTEILRHLPVENLIFGSDWPHPEGYANPGDAIADLGALTPHQQRLVLRENLRSLVFG
jgi:predicted TIM-barrel fold metal-dependent hydrolase